MKKIKLLILSAIIMILISGCASKDVKLVVEKCFNQYQAGNILGAEKFITDIPKGENMMGLKQEDLVLYSKAFSKLEYNISDISVSDDKADVSINLKVKNLSEVNGKLIDEIFRLAMVDNKSGWDIEAEMPLLYERFLDDAGMIEENISINLEKIDNEWKIKSSMDLKNALTGGLYSDYWVEKEAVD